MVPGGKCKLLQKEGENRRKIFKDLQKLESAENLLQPGDLLHIHLGFKGGKTQK